MPAPSGPQTVRVDEGAHGTMSFGPLRTRRTQWDQVPETPPLGFQPNQTRSRQNPYPMTGTIPSLPTPPGSSTFLEVINFDQDDDMVGMGVAPKFIGVTWKFDREQGRSLPQPRVHSQGTFNASQAEASFCPRDKLFYLAKAKSSFGQVEFARLSEPEKVAFREARKKELGQPHQEWRCQGLVS